ncbi:MAG: hypothetical protein PVI98_12550, partial [Burkholderiales bacterium]
MTLDRNLNPEGAGGPGVNGLVIRGNTFVRSTPDAVQPQVHFGRQGVRNFSLNADVNGNVFIGGDTQSNGPNLFYWDNNLVAAGGQVWRYAYPSGTHPDSRTIVFDANNNILQSDDGGLYRWVDPFAQPQASGTLTYSDSNPDTITRTPASGSFIDDGFVAGQRVAVFVSPTTPDGPLRRFGEYTLESVTATTLTFDASDDLLFNAGTYGDTVVLGNTWENLNTGRGAIEMLSVAYDPLNNVVLGGTQDNALSEQPSPLNNVDDDNDTFIDESDERLFWTEIAAGGRRPGDGNTVAVVPINNDGDPQFDAARRYTMSNNLLSLAQRDFDVNGNLIAGTDKLVNLSAFAQDTRQFTVNAGTNRLIMAAHGFGTGDQVWLHSTGDLPGGVSEGRPYFVIVRNANQIQLATTLANATATSPTAIDLTSIGSGTRTATERFTALSRADMRFTSGFQVLHYVANAVDPTRMALGLFSLYTSSDIGPVDPEYDGLDTIDQLDIPGAQPGNDRKFTAIAYGGMKDGSPNADVLYAARGNEILVRTANTWSAGDFTTERIGSASFITDIVLDSNDHDIAYAATDIGVFKRIAANPLDTRWVLISQRMTNPDLQSLEFAHVGGHDVLLAGGAAGVYRAIDPAPGGIWTEFGSNLPNALVFDLDFSEIDAADYENRPDPFTLPREDMLLAGTLGRGAWSVSGADLFLSDESVLQIEGTSGDDEISINRSADNAAIIEVHFGLLGDVLYTASIDTLQKIEVMGLGGNDTLTVDSTNGPISIAEGIYFDGGTGTNALTLEGVGAASNTSSTDGPQTTVTIVDARNARTQTVTYENVDPGSVTNSVAAATTSETFAVGWQGVFNMLDAWAAGASDELALVGNSLPRALSGRTAATIAPASDEEGGDSEAAATDALMAALNGGFARLIEEGLDGIQLEEIAGLSPTELRDRLDLLGDVTYTDIGGVQRYELSVTKHLEGEADLSVLASELGGVIDLGGALEIAADVELELIFGSDADGFFIDTGGTGSRLTFSNIAFDGALQASGRLGFLDVTIADATLTVDPSLELEVELVDPTMDGLIRIGELIEASLDPAALLDTFNFNVNGSGTDDFVFEADTRVAAFLSDGIAPFDLGEANIQFTWGDITDASTVGVTASVGVAEDLLNFLRVDVQEVLTQIQALADISVSFNGQEIPLLQDTLDQIVAVAQFLDHNIIDPLTNAGGQVSFGSIQELLSDVAQAIGIDPGELGLDFDTTSKELTWTFAFSESIFAEDSLSLGFDLEGGLADVQMSTDASIEASLDLGIIVGIDFDDLLATPAEPTRWMFVKDPEVSAELSLSAVDLDASARFGFVEVQIVDGSLIANPGFTLSLSDPGTIAANSRIELGELLDSIGAASLALTGSATISLPIAVPFLSIAAA